jgi:hypothetical protein
VKTIVLHRLALAVEVRDATTGGPAAGSVLAGLDRRGDGRFVLRRARRPAGTVGLALDGPGGVWTPRRLRTTLAPDGPPRRLTLSLFPGPGYPIGGGATAARLRVVRGAVAVPWPRATVFGPQAIGLTWTHGDRNGEMLVILPRPAQLDPQADTFPIVVRVHVPTAASEEPPEETVVSPPMGPQPPAPDDVARGRTVPASYVTVPNDTVLTVRIGEVATADITVP